MFPKKKTDNRLEVVVQSTSTSQPPSASANLQNSSVGMVLRTQHDNNGLFEAPNLGSVMLSDNCRDQSPSVLHGCKCGDGIWEYQFQLRANGCYRSINTGKAHKLLKSKILPHVLSLRNSSVCACGDWTKSSCKGAIGGWFLSSLLYLPTIERLLSMLSPALSTSERGCLTFIQTIRCSEAFNHSARLAICISTEASCHFMKSASTIP